MTLQVMKADKFIVRGLLSLSVPGQNEKDIWVDPRTGFEYIAKKPGKNGRIETLTEYLLNLIGLRVGLRMAGPGLAYRRGDLRFVSKKFHTSDQLLQHGHEFLAQFYSAGEVSAVHKNSSSERKLYSISHVLEGFEAAYLADADKFIKPFIKMIFFDALVGCQDRHFKNWGIVRSVRGTHPDFFAPVFDTARGLFWEYPSSRLRSCASVELLRYVRRSRPPIGDFEGNRVDHFTLVRQIIAKLPQFRSMLQHMVSSAKEQAVIAMLDAQLGAEFPKGRRIQLKTCLHLRFVTLREIAASKT